MKILANERLISNLEVEDIFVDDVAYKSAHGRSPKSSEPGAGWYFSKGRRFDPIKEHKGRDYFVSDRTARTYRDAVQQAKEWAVSRGHFTIYLQP